MRKRIITLFACVAFISCSAPSDITRINENRCWEALPSDGRVRGSLIIHYYPDVTTFASNSECPERSIFLSVDDKGAAALRKAFDLVKDDRKDAIGVYFSAHVAGSIYRVRGEERIYIRVSHLSIMPTKRPKVI